MSVYNIHAGHCPQGNGAYGATGILYESVENRLVKDEVIRLLKKYKHTVYDCTVDEPMSAYQCLISIVKKCNKNKVSLDVSIHLNSGRMDPKGDGKTGGVEVYNYSIKTREISDRICKNISQELGITNRGSKYNQSLYVLRKTISPAILIECCFVDDEDDVKRWDYKKCAKAIVEGILNSTIEGEEKENKLEEDGYWGRETTKLSQQFLETYVDGIVSRQSAGNKKYLVNAAGGWEFFNDYEEYKKGSPMIRKLQEKTGLGIKQTDGIAGRITVSSLQRYLILNGYTCGPYGIDGILGKDTVTAWQKFLNENTK